MNKLKLSLANWLIKLAVFLRRQTPADYSATVTPSILVRTWSPAGGSDVVCMEDISSGADILRVVQEYAYHKELCNIVVLFPKAAHSK